MFLDMFGNQIVNGDFIAWGSSGIQILRVEKQYIDGRGNRKLRVEEVELDGNGGFTVTGHKKYVFDWIKGVGVNQSDPTLRSQSMIKLKLV